MVTVSISLALICFAGECHNALVGHDTPVGNFQLIQRLTQQPGYGGDVLQFKETNTAWYAVHRVWTHNPAQRREERLKSSNPKDRVTVTKGCVNVDPKVYDLLKACCANDTIIITQ